MEVKFNPEVMLNHEERGQVTFTMATPGFQHINRIMRAEVDKFIVDLIKVAEDNKDLIIAKHLGAKNAAEYYQRIVNRLNEESSTFAQERGGVGKPEDSTEGLLDLGESIDPEEPFDPASLLEGFEINEQLVEEELSSE